MKKKQGSIAKMGNWNSVCNKICNKWNFVIYFFIKKHLILFVLIKNLKMKIK
jgi:hypothetical protein